MKQFKVTLGLGRMANNHPRTYIVSAQDETKAISVAKGEYYEKVENEIGKKNPIWGKFLTVSEIEEVKESAS